MDDGYSVENLVSRFKVHLDYSMKESKERAEKYEKEYGKPFPKYGPDPDFHITKALIRICEEIVGLKKIK